MAHFTMGTGGHYITMLPADWSISTSHDPLPSSCHSKKMLWNPSIHWWCPKSSSLEGSQLILYTDDILWCPITCHAGRLFTYAMFSTWLTHDWTIWVSQKVEYFKYLGLFLQQTSRSGTRMKTKSECKKTGCAWATTSTCWTYNIIREETPWKCCRDYEQNFASLCFVLVWRGHEVLLIYKHMVWGHSLRAKLQQHPEYMCHGG